MLEVELNEFSRYIVPCNLVSNICLSNRKVDFIIDTGAVYTTCRASTLSMFLTQDIFSGCDTSVFGGYTGIGFNSPLHYKHSIKSFRIGNIDLGSQDIWVTFDERVGANLLGMDILSKIGFLQLRNENKLLLFDDIIELSKYAVKYYKG